MSEKLIFSDRKEFLPYGHQWIDEDDIKAVIDVLKTDWITQGPKIAEFEKLIADYCDVKYAVAFSSGTAALHAASFTVGISNGDEVITTPITFAADANCVLYMGGTVKFADITQDTHNIDPEKIKKRINSKTKAILPVDYTGHPCDIDEINKIAKEHNLTVIHDVCHSLGGEYKGKKVGGLADLSVLSFHPVKVITTGEGGMVLTNNKEFYNRLKIFRTHGITKDPEQLHRNEGDWYYEMQHLGFNYRITDFQCALGISQFKKLDKFIKRRREIASQYNDAFSKLDEIVTPYEKENVKSAYHLYMIQLNLEMLKGSRKEIFDGLRAENIGVHVHYIPVHLLPYYQKRFGYQIGDFPIAEDFYNRAITLPLFPKMNNDDVNYVIESIFKVINQNKK